MAYDPQIHHRHSIRLKGYDYTQPDAYFITICTKARQCLFGNVVKSKMQLNYLGHIAFNYWQTIPDHFPHIELDTFSSRSALPHPNPPLIKGRELDFLVSPLYKGGLRGVKRLWDKHLGLS
ncbi:MAG: hypothetical protein V7K90_13320 [Nostoc sp.]|uniref:hypothetical protein n=1 Tax=Nostoc sp. TaxID=1180 RepID=UPI002FF5EF36